MSTELLNETGTVYLSIQADEENQWIQATWHDCASSEEAVRAGMDAYLTGLQETHYTALLIDTRSLANCWHHTPAWMLQEWAQRAAQTGLDHYALVVTPESFATANQDPFYAQVTSFEAEVFSDLATARAWLRLCRLNLETQNL